MYNEGMFLELVESSDDIVIVTDKEFIIRYVSPSVLRLFGIEPIDLLGTYLFSLIEPVKIDDWKNCLLSNKGASVQEEISIEIQKNQRAYFDAHVSRLTGNAAPGMVVRLHDVTSKKAMEQELIRSNKQMDQVLYKTTHDLQAPLKSAMGLIKLAEQAPAEENQKYLALIKKSLMKLDFFIEEMNHFFRNEKLAVQRERINLVTMVNEEIANLKSLYEENKLNVKCEVHSSSDFYSDNIRLKTIVGNVLSNAIKYFDPKKPEPFINISVYSNEAYCEIRFADNGIGIEEPYQEKIFDLFFRGTTQSQGTGLGLFIVKDTIEKLKGSIDVKSQIGQGSTFTIRIPNQIYQPVEVA